ncbi:MAG: 3-dehydroquinate synthase [Alphaproteobacteria bacterium]|nr:3-dehydroquinate synthase [Alphaproteobacteria bacterium]
MLIEVELPDAAYPIHVVDGGLEGLGGAVAQALRPGPAFVVTNPVVGALYAHAACASLRGAGFRPIVVEIPDGEAHKTVSTWQGLVEDLLAAGIRRSDPVVALGGGVTGDIAGFAAATVLRGVPLVQVPTSLLAMVDSAVGGKTGVNSPRGKNLIGAFYQPRLVYAGMATLATLADDELRSGLGEVVKHGVLADPALFELCRARAAAAVARAPEVLAEMVERSCRVKASIVARDEREQGLRAVLNLGHTAGHAVETCVGHGTLRHGECVAIGLVAETRWAEGRGDAAAGLASEVEAVVAGLGLPTVAPPIDPERLVAAAGYDKKTERGMVRSAVTEQIGRVRLDLIPQSELPNLLSHLYAPSEPR